MFINADNIVAMVIPLGDIESWSARIGLSLYAVCSYCRSWRESYDTLFWIVKEWKTQCLKIIKSSTVKRQACLAWSIINQKAQTWSYWHAFDYQMMLKSFYRKKRMDFLCWLQLRVVLSSWSVKDQVDHVWWFWYVLDQQIKLKSSCMTDRMNQAPRTLLMLLSAILITIVITILRSGDVEVNPGPETHPSKLHVASSQDPSLAQALNA